MKKLRVLSVIGVFLFGAHAFAGDRVAFVLGVDQYTHLSPESQLSAAVSDAKRMDATLRSLDPAFKVTLITDADWRTAQKEFDTFLTQARSAECVLVYFAGHGIEYNGKNYLIVKDSDISDISPDVDRMKRRLEAAAISMQSWVDSLDGTLAQVKVVILDCCRDNPFQAQDRTGKRSVVGTRRGLAPVTAPSGTLISYAADAGQSANDGLFTSTLTANLRIPGLSMMKVFAKTREEVLRTSTEWAEEDAAKGLVPEECRPRHEPAEYSKLNLAGTDFTFTVSAKTGGSAETLVAPVMTPPASPTSPVEPPSGRGAVLDRGSIREGWSIDIGGGQKVTVRYVPGGEFLMGIPADEAERGDDENQVRVTLSSHYWMGETEVTQGQWEAVMGSNPSKFKGASLPVEQVSHDDAEGFIGKLNAKSRPASGWRWALPSEAQWERACRGGTETVFSYGNSLDSTQANFDGNYPYGNGKKGPYLEKTAAVKSYAANGYGLYDMHGNVWEWCSDWYGETLPGGVDPQGPKTGSGRVGRGGSWNGYGGGCRSADRGRLAPGLRFSLLGFRLAAVPEER